MSTSTQNFGILLNKNQEDICKTDIFNNRMQNGNQFNLNDQIITLNKNKECIKMVLPNTTLENNLGDNTINLKTPRQEDNHHPQELIFDASKNQCKLFSVSNNKIQAVISPSIKSGIYRKIIKETNSSQNDANKSINSSKTMEEKLESLAINILELTPGKFKIYKNRNILVKRDIRQHKRFIYKILEPRSLNLHTPSFKISTNICKIRKCVGRPRNSNIVKYEPKKQIIPVSITRSGRISKPKLIEGNCESLSSIEILKEFDQNIHLNEIKDKDFKYYKDISKPTETTAIENIINEKCTTKRTRKLPSDSECPVCHKILLGKRMKKHFETFPDHNIKNLTKAQSSVYEQSLYKFLVNKLKLVCGDDNDQKTDLFLTELSDLIEQIQLRNSKLVQNTSGIHFVSTKLSKILGIPEGQYSININAIESVPDSILSTEEIIPLRPLAPPQPRLADYNLSISLDDTITAKLNLSDNIIPSEESLLRTVNDLVHQRIKKMNDHDDISLNGDILQITQNNNKTSVIHYDHASDNAVEAVNIKGTIQPPILDLSLDLFQFRSN